MENKGYLYVISALIAITLTIPVFGLESENVKKVPYNTYVDEVYGFSIIPPTGWAVEAPMVHEDPEALPSLFGVYYEIPTKEYDPLMTIEFTSNPEIWDHLEETGFSNSEVNSMFENSNMNKLLESVVKAYSNNFDNTAQTKILDKSVKTFHDGYMTRVLVTDIFTAENFEEPISAKTEFVDVWLPDGDHFQIYFTTRSEDYEKYSQAFEESLSTFYIGKVEKLPSPKPSFVDPNKDPQHYLDRYYNEPEYKEWFDRNYPNYTIEEAVGIEQESKIPEWIKNIFGWYSQGQIGDDELIKTLQFLIKEGIIQVE